jgi:hypothetical protein
MKDGGFDIIIGNPPYVRQETLGTEFKDFAKGQFETFAGTADLYIYFIEQAHKLLKPNGYFGMIVSNKWIRSNYGKALREYLSKNAAIQQIVDFGELPVFENAATFPVIILTRKAQTEKQNFIFAPIKRLDFYSLADEVKSIGSILDESSLRGENWTLSNSNEQIVLDKMRQVGIPFSEYSNGQAYYGIKTGYDKAFIIDLPTKNRLVMQDAKSAELIKPYVIGDDIRKYQVNFNERFLILIPKGWTNENAENTKDAWKWFNKKYPAIAKHLEPHAEPAMKRSDKGDYWWELRACSYYDAFEKTKIVYPEIARESRFAFDDKKIFCNKTTFIVPQKDFYLLAILNSKLAWAFFKRTCSVLGDPDKGGRLLMQYIYVSQLPIRRIDFTNPVEKAAHDEIVSLVEKMLSLQKELQSFTSKLYQDEIREVERKIAHVDEEINQRVYRLYGLSEEEIKIVEGK